MHAQHHADGDLQHQRPGWQTDAQHAPAALHARRPRAVAQSLTDHPGRRAPGRLLLLACAGALALCGAGPADRLPPEKAVWTAPGTDKAVRATVGWGEARPPGVTAAQALPAMEARLGGVVATLDARALQALQRATLPRPSYTPGDRRAALTWTLALESGPGAPAALVRMERWTDGVVTVARLGEAGLEGDRLRLKPEALATLQPWGAVAGDLDRLPALPARGVTAKLDGPCAPGWITFDQATIESRMEGGKPTVVPAAVRDLDREALWARLPARYSPRTLPGLLVWIDAGPEGRPPAAYAQLFDELNLVCIAPDNAGNARVVSERFQLALDAVATAQARWPIDPRRVYVAGISGGGKVASMLAICLPDVFTGAVPVVGFAGYKGVQIGRGGAASVGRPSPALIALLRTRRLAPITGARDFNRDEIAALAQAHSGDGLQIKVIDDPMMRHEMAPPDRFAEALRWVDEPAQAALDAAAKTADAELKGVRARFGDGPPRNAQHRKALEGVLAAGPWTPAAWTAHDLLAAGDRPVTPARPAP